LSFAPMTQCMSEAYFITSLFLSFSPISFTWVTSLLPLRLTVSMISLSVDVVEFALVSLASSLFDFCFFWHGLYGSQSPVSWYNAM
jgi:hypothetical protein